MLKNNEYEEKLVNRIAHILRILRENAELTQDDLARKLNVSRSSYANWENGENFPPLKAIDQMTIIYNVSMDYILGRTTIKKYQAEIRPMSINIISKNLLQHRKENKFTYLFLGKYCNMSTTNYFYIEKGKQAIKPYQLSKLLDLYQISADKFTGKID